MGETVDPTAAALVEAAHAHGATLATAESLTGGLVAATIVSVPGASRVLVGGVVAYSVAVKTAMLGVDADLVATVGTVDEGVVRQMAEGARRALSADVALATTGVAGPGPAEGRPAGTAWIACATPDGTDARELLLEGGRDAVRRGCTVAVLALAVEVLSRESVLGGTVEHDQEPPPEESR